MFERLVDIIAGHFNNSLKRVKLISNQNLIEQSHSNYVFNTGNYILFSLDNICTLFSIIIIFVAKNSMKQSDRKNLLSLSAFARIVFYSSKGLLENLSERRAALCFRLIIKIAQYLLTCGVNSCFVFGAFYF